MSWPRLVLSALTAGVLLAASAAVTACAPSTIVGGQVAAASRAGERPPDAKHPDETHRDQAASGATTPEETRQRVDALRELVTSRLGAVERDDRAAWLAPLAAEVSQAERAAQGRIFDRMTAMGVSDLRVVSMEVHPAATAGATPPSATAAPRAGVGGWRARLTGTYRLRGFDSAPRTFTAALTAGGTTAADGTSPGGANTTAITSWLPADRPQPWDLEGLLVQRGPAGLLLVVGTAADAADLRQRISAAAQRVAAVWGRAEPAVWVAPGSDADAARLLGRDAAGLTGVAAVTDGPLRTGERAGADRIVLVPRALAGLRGAGRDVVITHELTHATVRASTTRAVPHWLAEGFAELVAYRSIALAEPEVVAPALDVVRARGLPAALPAEADFDPGARRLAAAYGLSLLAVRTIAERHGTPALVRLYRDAAGAVPVPATLLGDAESTTDRSLDRLGTDRATLVGQWRDRISALLAP